MKKTFPAVCIALFFCGFFVLFNSCEKTDKTATEPAPLETAGAAPVAVSADTLSDGFEPSTPTPLGFEAVAVSLVEQAGKADFDSLKIVVSEAESDGMTDALIDLLEKQAALPDAPPAVHVALSVLYGRKGLKTKEYAALALAEEAAKQPGVVFNIALVHGRKKLLEGSPDADSFIVGSFDLVSDPPGASVYLDGKPAGSSPVRLEKIKAGAHSIRLELSGYDPWSADFNLGVGKTVALVETLQAKPALLALKVVPSGAVVKIDGNPVSITNPVTLEHGTHELTIEEPNSKKIVEALSVNPGESVSRSYTMEPAVFNWSFDTTPRGGIVSLDGKEIGIAPIENYPVVAGKHQVTVNLDKYEVLNETRNFDRGMNANFVHQFTLIEAPYRIPTKTIRLKNREDWNGVEPVPMKDFDFRDTMPNLAGTAFKRVFLAQDTKYVYWLMEFSDGKPAVNTGVNYAINCYVEPGNKELHIAMKLGDWGEAGTYKPHLPYGPVSNNYDDKWNDAGSSADYYIGPDYLVARFPRANLLKVLKTGTNYRFVIQMYLRNKDDKKWSGFEMPKVML